MRPPGCSRHFATGLNRSTKHPAIPTTPATPLTASSKKRSEGGAGGSPAFSGLRRFPPHALDHPHPHQGGDLDGFTLRQPLDHTLGGRRDSNVQLLCVRLIPVLEQHPFQVLTVWIDFHNALIQQVHPIVPVEEIRQLLVTGSLSGQPDPTGLVFRLCRFHRFFRYLCFSRGLMARIWNTSSRTPSRR